MPALEEPAPADTTHRAAGTRLTLGVLVVFALVVAHSFHSKLHRAELESWTESTAVGDRQYFPLTQPAPALTFQGQKLVPASPQPEELFDIKMQRLGLDEAGQFLLYRSADVPATRSEEPNFYVKTETNRFLKLQPEKK